MLCHNFAFAYSSIQSCVHASSVIQWCCYVLLIQRQIKYSELSDVEAIAEGGFGVIHRAKHAEWGTVVYKELKSSIIPDGSKFVKHTLYFVVSVRHRRNLWGCGVCVALTFWRGYHTATFWPCDRINMSDVPSSSAHVSRYNIQENVVWRLGFCQICPTHRPFNESNTYNLGNSSRCLQSISGQIALASLFSSPFGPHLSLLFKLH